LGGLWQTVMLGFAGVDLMDDTFGIDPKLPPQWRSLSFRVCWKGRVAAIRIAGRTVHATLAMGEAMDIRIARATHKLMAGTKPSTTGFGSASLHGRDEDLTASALSERRGCRDD
jgi:trehalose/maltose hydrolase-like predicted phosphorylase